MQTVVMNRSAYLTHCVRIATESQIGVFPWPNALILGNRILTLVAVSILVMTTVFVKGYAGFPIAALGGIVAGTTSKNLFALIPIARRRVDALVTTICLGLGVLTGI
jgi:hypothetical protein